MYLKLKGKYFSQPLQKKIPLIQNQVGNIVVPKQASRKASAQKTEAHSRKEIVTLATDFEYTRRSASPNTNSEQNIQCQRTKNNI